MTQPQPKSETSSQSPASPNQTSLPPAKSSNRKLPAWLLSLCLHCVIFSVLFLILAQYPSGGAAEVENRTGGIVLVDTKSETTEYLDEGDVEESSQENASEQPPPMAIKNDPAPDLAGLESADLEITGAGESLVEGMSGAESLIAGLDNSRIGEVGGKVTTEVFGVEGTGSRFVYVFDRSKSMDGFQRRPMLAARAALLKSLSSLTKANQFQVIFYNNGTTIFKKDGMQKMFFATDENKKSAENFINSTRPDGGTDHINALKSAFRMGPDVIFLLTDAEGGFTAKELRDLTKFNTGAVINAIQFGERRGRDQSLQRVAEMTGGSYVFKNIESLRVKDN